MIHPLHWSSWFPVHFSSHVILSALLLSEDTLARLQASCHLSRGLGGLCPRVWTLHGCYPWFISGFLQTFIETFQPARHWLDAVHSSTNLKGNKHDSSVYAVVVISSCSLLVYRKAVDFYVLTLYPTTLLWLLLSSRWFFWLILSGSLYRRSCNLPIKTVLFLPNLYFFFLMYYLGLPARC